jgi:DNA replication and repair protein RecF
MSGLCVESLTLSHFRSHKRAVMEFDGRPVAIYGPNGAGKTNVLEAISLLSPGRGLRRGAAEEMVRRPEAIGWKIAALLQSPTQSYEIETQFEIEKGRQLRIDGKSVPQITLGKVAKVLWLVPSMDRLWIEGAEGRRRFLDRATLSFVPSHAEAVLSYEKAMRERNRLLKDMVRDPHWYGALEQQMAQAGAQITANRQMAIARLSAAQTAAETAFPVADLTLVDADSCPETEAELIEAFAAGRARDMAAGRALIGPHRSDLGAVFAAKNVPASDCSTGEQKALLISLILANCRALEADFGAAPILLLDEVAAHLDARRRAALYDEICAIGAQAFMTGTGPELFSELQSRSQYLEVTEDQGTSAVAQKEKP